jgi:hypothetical protein
VDGLGVFAWLALGSSPQNGTQPSDESADLPHLPEQHGPEENPPRAPCFPTTGAHRAGVLRDEAMG